MERRYPEEQNVPPERHYLEVRASGGSFVNVQERDYLEVHASGSGTVPFVPETNGQNENAVEREVYYGNVSTAQHPTEVSEDTYDLTISPKATEDASVYMTASQAAENLYMNVTTSAADSERTDSMPEMASSSTSSAAASDEDLGPHSVCVESGVTSAEPLFRSPFSLPPTILVRAHDDTPAVTSSILHSGEPLTEQSAVQSPVSSPSALPLFSQSSEVKVENPKSSFHLPSYDEAITSADEELSRYGDSQFANRSLLNSGNTRSRCSTSSIDLASSNGELSTNCASGIAEFPPPPPYSTHKVLFKGANLPLKQIQVQKLIEEMSAPQGVQVIIPKNQCQHSIAFTDCFNKVW